MTFDLYVVDEPDHGPPGPPLPPAMAATGQPSSGQALPIAPADQARIALRTRNVALVKRLGSARIYARRSAVRRGLAPTAGEAALAVTCPLECRLDSRVRARSPGTPERAAGTHTSPSWDGGARATHAQSRRPPASSESRRLRGLGDHARPHRPARDGADAPPLSR